MTTGYDYTKYWNSPDREYYDRALDLYELHNAAGTLAPQFKQAIELRIADLYGCAGAICRQADLAAPVPAIKQR